MAESHLSPGGHSPETPEKKEITLEFTLPPDRRATITITPESGYNPSSDSLPVHIAFASSDITVFLELLNQLREQTSETTEPTNGLAQWLYEKAKKVNTNPEEDSPSTQNPLDRRIILEFELDPDTVHATVLWVLLNELTRNPIVIEENNLRKSVQFEYTAEEVSKELYPYDPSRGESPYDTDRTATYIVNITITPA